MKNSVIEIMIITGIKDKILFSKNFSIGWFPLDKNRRDGIQSALS
jgi:hypothetical protein